MTTSNPPSGETLPEINLEIEGFLAVGGFVNGVFNLLFVAVFLVLVRLVK
jgi:hypothetical protein